MTAPELKAKRRFTVINTRDDVAQQINRAQKTAEPIVLRVEAENGYPSKLTLPLLIFVLPDGEGGHTLFAESEREEEVTVELPSNHELPAIAWTP